MKLYYDSDNEEFKITESNRLEYNQLKGWLTRKKKGWRFDPRVKLGVWNGEFSYFKDGKFKMGLWKECIKAIQLIGEKVEIENKNEFPIDRDVTYDKVKEFCDEFFNGHKYFDGESWKDFYPHDHQIDSAFKILKNRYCLAEVATSGGKSLIISIVFFYIIKKIKPDAKFLILVPSISLVTQFYDGLMEYNFGANNLKENKKPKQACDLVIEEIMSDTPRRYGLENTNIYIGTYQSLDKRDKEFFKQFYGIATDESHMAKAKTYMNILSSTIGHAHLRFGVSGTFPTEETLEILTIQSLLGPIISNVTAHELKEKGIITEMDVKIVMANHNDPEFAMRINQIKKSGLGKEALELEKRYIHESEQRFKLIKTIVSKCEKNTLVLFNTIEYGNKLLEYLSVEIPEKEFYYIDGSISNKKREEIKKQMEDLSGKSKVLIASYGTLSTGVSIKAIFNVIFTDSYKSEQIVIQSIGRALRLHKEKEKAIIFDIVDIFEEKPKNILYTQFKERMKFYEKRKYPYKIKNVLLNFS